MIAGLILAAALQAGTGLDCAAGPEALVAQIAARPGIKAYPGADPLLETWSEPTGTLYAATKPGHAAHPAVVRRVLNQGARTTVDTSACGYGDKAGYEALMQQIERLNAALIARYGG